jgi:hypothetical protein
MTPELAAAVENAYRVFARYDLRGGVTVCRCNVCVAPEIERELNTVPLREMSSSLLAEYTSSAHGFDGKTENDFRHYLPRYFELIAMDAPPTTLDEEICLERLHAAGYRANWGPSEVAAVERFFLTLFRERVAAPFEIDAMGWTDYAPDRAEAMLCMVGHAGGNLAPLLSAWSADIGRMATLHIANVVASADWNKKRLRDSWWSGLDRPHAEAAMGQVMAWLLRPDIRARLEAACLGETDEGAAALLSHAEGLVAGLM